MVKNKSIQRRTLVTLIAVTIIAAIFCVACTLSLSNKRVQKTEYLAADAHPTQAQLTSIGYSFKTYIMRVSSGTSVKIFYNGSDRTFAAGDTQIFVLQNSAGNVPFVQTLESSNGNAPQAYIATAQSSNPTNAVCLLGSIYSHNGTNHVFSFASPSSLNDLYIDNIGRIYYNYLDHNGVEKVYYIGTSGFVEYTSIGSANFSLSQTTYTYSGSACKPTPIVVLNASLLTLNKDYTVAYSDNTNAGTATITITGIGNYYGTRIAYFKISRQSVSGATVSLSDTTYTGSACTPTPTVVVNGRTLTLNTDYTVTYSNNINVGTATVTIKGIGNYYETRTADFTISRQPVSGASVTLSQSSYTYSGSACKPTPTVKLGSRTLTLGTDYTVTYSNNTYAGTATVTITGIGNYYGTKTAAFKINKANQTFSATSASHTVEALSGSARIAFIGTKSTAAHAFSSSDTRVATVSSQGVITAGNKVGTATVTVTNGGDSNYNARTVTISVTTALSNGFYIGVLNGENTVYKTLDQAVAAVGNNGTVKIKGSPTVNATVNTNKNFTLSGDTNAKITRGSGFTGSILNVTGGALKIENLTLDGDNVSGSSLVTSSGALTVKSGAKFINGNATNGGAIYSSGGTLTVESGANFTGNTARANGGAIYIADGVTNSINGGVMSNNLAAVGDAIYIDNNTLNFNGTSATSGITDGIGIGGTGSVNVTNGLTHKVSVEFKDPENQKNDAKQYVTSSTNPKLTSQQLKEYFRVVNSGFTFGTTVENALIMQNSTTDVARVNGIVYKDLQSAIDAAAAIGGNVTVELIQYVNNTTPSLSTDTIEVASTLVIPDGANITFSSIVKNTTENGTNYEWIAATNPTVLLRANNLTSELVRVSDGASLTLGDVVLDGGAVWSGGTPKVTDDGKGGAGTAVTNNSGVTAHAPIIVNGGTLNIKGAIVRNNDNNYAKPGEGFGSQNYGGGVRNEGGGTLVMTGGSIENCYSREGGAIMNVNKPNSPAYVSSGAPSVTVSGGSITGNSSQMKGAAIQTIYGGAKTTVSGSANIENNKSLYDLGSLAVEEGGSLIISGGSVAAGSGNDNAVYVYNKYAAENYDVNSASKPFIEGNGAAQITITGNPTIGKTSGSSVVGGDVHLDNPCAVVNPDTGKPSSTVYNPIINMSGYSGSSNINIDLDSDRAYGDVVTTNSDLKVTVNAQPDSKKYEVSYSYTKEVTVEGGKKLVSGGFAFDMTQTEPGAIIVNGICDPTVDEVVFTINGSEYKVAATNGIIDGVVDISEVADVEISATVKPTFNDGTTTIDTVNATFKAVLFDAATAKITAPDNTYYIDEAGERKPLSNGTLANDVAIDADGNAQFEVDGEVRKILIGVRADDLTASDIINANGAFIDLTVDTITFTGAIGYEYNIVDSGGRIVSDWKGAENIGADGKGEVVFSGLISGENYDIVVRRKAVVSGGEVVKIPSKSEELRAGISVLSVDEAAKKKEFDDAYNAVRDGLTVNGGAPTASVSDIQAVIDKYNVISNISVIAELPSVADKIEHLRKSLDRASATAWAKTHEAIINKNSDDITLSDEAVIDSAVEAFFALSDGAKEFVSHEFANLSEKQKLIAAIKINNAASAAIASGCNESAINKIVSDYIAKLNVVEIGAQNEIDVIVMRATAKIEVLVYYDEVTAAATADGLVGFEEIVTAKNEAFDLIDRVDNAENGIDSAIASGKHKINGALSVVILENYLSESDSDEVKAIVSGEGGAKDRIYAAATQAELDEIVEETKIAVDAGRFKDRHHINKPFIKIAFADLSGIHAARNEYEGLTNDIKSALDVEVQRSGYTDYGRYLDDCANKAKFEGKREEIIAAVTVLIRQHDGERVYEMLSKQCEEIKKIEYMPCRIGSIDEHLEGELERFDDAYNVAKEEIKHSQKQQRVENQLINYLEERVSSGQYNEAQKATLEELLEKAKSEISEFDSSDSNSLEVLLERVKNALDEVPIVAVSTGGIKPDKSPVTSGVEDYEAEEVDEFWGIVTNDESMPSGIKLFIERTDKTAEKQIKDAASSGKMTAAEGSALSEEQLRAAVSGKEIKATLDIYLLKNETKITEFEGKYTVKVLLTAELRAMRGLQVVYLNDDGSMKVFETTIEDDKYIVFTTTHFSEFYILGEPIIDLTWLIVLLSVLLGLELIVIAALIFKRVKSSALVEEPIPSENDGAASGACAVPFMSAVIIPIGAVPCCIVLGCAVFAAAAAIFVLVYLRAKHDQSGGSQKELEESDSTREDCDAAINKESDSTIEEQENEHQNETKGGMNDRV